MTYCLSLTLHLRLCLPIYDKFPKEMEGHGILHGNISIATKENNKKMPAMENFKKTLDVLIE